MRNLNKRITIQFLKNSGKYNNCTRTGSTGKCHFPEPIGQICILNLQNYYTIKYNIKNRNTYIDITSHLIQSSKVLLLIVFLPQS